MAPLVHLFYASRRLLRNGIGWMLSLGIVAVLWLHGFEGAWPHPTPEHLTLAVAWVAIFVARIAARSRRELAGDDPPWWLDLELGVLLLVAVHASLQATGGHGGPLRPLLYVLAATMGALAQPRASLGWFALAVALDVFLLPSGHAWRTLAPHAAFLGFFALLSGSFARLEVRRARHISNERLQGAFRRAIEEGRRLRLVGAAGSEGAHDEEGLLRASVEEIHEQVYHVLSLLHGTMDLHACVLLALDEQSERLHLVERVSEDDSVQEGPWSAKEGAVGAVVQRGEPLHLHPLRPGYTGIPYYDGPAPISSFAAIPLLEEERLVGVLCADRKTGRPFDAREMELLQRAARQALRAMHNERLFLQMERSKREQAILFRSSRRLGAALDEDAVVQAAFEASAEIAPVDVMLLTSFDPARRRHEVRHASGPLGEGLEGLQVGTNRSLLDMAVRHGHPLPYRGAFDPKRQVLCSGRHDPRSLRSALVLPLLAREEPLGALVLGSRREGAFGSSARATLQMLANQLAVAMANVKAVQRLERMATTDGLTGCLNKRAFLEGLESRMKAARRFGAPLSLLVTDIDHFKQVNDTYGHDVGDVVIKALGDVLRKLARETDLVARFGGEEFCILCEQTDARGAALLAERIRESLAALQFPTPMGTLRVTCSVGVAAFPSHAADAPSLFKAADEALYAAKRGGRNQVRTYEGRPIAQAG